MYDTEQANAPSVVVVNAVSFYITFLTTCLEFHNGVYCIYLLLHILFILLHFIRNGKYSAGVTQWTCISRTASW